MIRDRQQTRYTATLPWQALAHGRLTPADLRVLAVLRFVADGGRVAQVARRELATRARCSDRQARYSLLKLAGLGYVTIEPEVRLRDGLSAPRVYMLSQQAFRVDGLPADELAADAAARSAEGRRAAQGGRPAENPAGEGGRPAETAGRNVSNVSTASTASAVSTVSTPAPAPAAAAPPLGGRKLHPAGGTSGSLSAGNREAEVSYRGQFSAPSPEGRPRPAAATSEPSPERGLAAARSDPPPMAPGATSVPADPPAATAEPSQLDLEPLIAASKPGPEGALARSLLKLGRAIEQRRSANA